MNFRQIKLLCTDYHNKYDLLYPSGIGSPEYQSEINLFKNTNTTLQFLKISAFHLCQKLTSLFSTIIKQPVLIKR